MLTPCSAARWWRNWPTRPGVSGWQSNHPHHTPGRTRPGWCPVHPLVVAWWCHWSAHPVELLDSLAMALDQKSGGGEQLLEIEQYTVKDQKHQTFQMLLRSGCNDMGVCPGVWSTLGTGWFASLAADPTMYSKCQHEPSCHAEHSHSHLFGSLSGAIIF